MSQRKTSVEKTKRKSSLPIDFNNLNFDILNPDHLSKIQGPDYYGYADVSDSFLSKSHQYNFVNNMTVTNSMNVSRKTDK